MQSKEKEFSGITTDREEYRNSLAFKKQLSLSNRSKFEPKILNLKNEDASCTQLLLSQNQMNPIPSGPKSKTAHLINLDLDMLSTRANQTKKWGFSKSAQSWLPDLTSIGPSEKFAVNT